MKMWTIFPHYKVPQVEFKLQKNQQGVEVIPRKTFVSKQAITKTKHLHLRETRILSLIHRKEFSTCSASVDSCRPDQGWQDFSVN